MDLIFRTVQQHSFGIKIWSFHFTFQSQTLLFIGIEKLDDKTKNLWAEYICMDITGWGQISSLFAFKIIMMLF